MALKKDHKGRPVVEAIGNIVRSLREQPEYEVVNPFSHPRVLVNNFQKAEKILQHAFRYVHKSKFFAPSPRVVVQPMEKIEGGLTDVEERVFRELCLSAGAREVFLHVGEQLSLFGMDINKLKAEGKLS